MFSYLWWAELGGIGRSPLAPGTVATALAGGPAAVLLNRLPLGWRGLGVTALFVFACLAAHHAELALDRHDPSRVVIDELVGYLATVLWFPFDTTTAILGFFLFRAFDIWKPWPASLCNELRGGLWVVMDDVAAGLYAALLMWFIRTWW
jgi:phosphatidylglycerophosphatase A